MRRFLILPAVLLSLLVLPDCSGKVGEFLKVATTTVTNPVDAVDIYRAKTVYAVAVDLAAGYRQYCWSKPYAALMKDPVAAPVCRNRRPNVRAMIAADHKAFAAIGVAENFVRNNPTLNATKVLGAAWAAVTEFQSLTTRTTVAAR